jgi:hypothetical protein
MSQSIDPSPSISILCLALDDVETFKDVDDVVDPSALHCELLCALVKIQQVHSFAPIELQEPSAKFTKTLLFSVIRSNKVRPELIK